MIEEDLAQLKNLSALLDDAMQGCVPEDLKAKGWKYQDFPTRFSPQAWTYILAVMGEDEYKILVMSEGVGKHGPWVRGQFLISPQGYINLADPERRKQFDYMWGTDS